MKACIFFTVVIASISLLALTEVSMASEKLSGTLTDISGITVGHAESSKRPTGVTVIRFPKTGITAGYDQRGGAPGTRETDLLSPVNLVDHIHAIVFAGGSAFGLDTAQGVMKCLEEEKIGFPTQKDVVIPIVPAAIIYDLGVGDPKIRPDAKLGYKACKAASKETVRQGNVGAGAGATVGKMLGMKTAMKGGLGSYSIKIDDHIIVAALVVVNALGDVIDPDTGKIVAGTRASKKGEFADSEKLIIDPKAKTIFSSTNTTIGIVAVNAAFSKTELTRLAQMAQDGLARAIRPSHTMFDGDTIFSVAVPNSETKTSLNLSSVGAAMAKVLSKAILNAIENAQSISGIPAKKDWTSSSVSP